MKKLLAIVGILVVMTALTYGQEFVSSQAPGAKALLFQFQGLDNLNANAYAGGLGMKFFLSEYLALRTVVNINYDTYSEPYYDRANPTQTGTDYESNSFGIGVGAAIEYHLTKGRLTPYIGAGVQFYTLSTEELEAVPSGTTQPKVENGYMDPATGDIVPNASTSIGVVLLIGGEYYITNGLSLSAEYQIGLKAESIKDAEATIGAVSLKVPGGTATDIGITTAGFLTLALYF